LDLIKIEQKLILYFHKDTKHISISMALSKQEIISNIKAEIPFIDIKPYSHNIISLNLTFLEEQYGKDEVKKIVKETRLKHKGWGHLIGLPDGCYTSCDWCIKVGYPEGIYETFKDMIIEEYGDESEQAKDLDKTYREAVLANEPEPFMSERCLIGECDCEGDEKATCDGSNLVRD